MKFISLILTFCLSFNVLAQELPIQELEKALDEYQYALTVEWDQQDKDFQSAQTNLFFNQVKTQIQRGLTKSDINLLMQKKITDKNTLAQMQNELSLLAANADSSEDLIRIFSDHANQMYQQGASWEASKPVQVGVIAAVSALFIYSVYFTIKTCGGVVTDATGKHTYCEEGY